MIISYPFLGDQDNKADETQAENVRVDINDYECAHGIYPVSFNQRWHGGCHLQPQHTKEPICAIADGIIVAYRIASDMVTDGNNQKHHNSFVLLKHTTETGEGRSITFYSLYMHLHCLDSGVTQPERLKVIEKLRTASGASTSGGVHDGQTKVNRKDILGYAGGMYGNCFIHFEVFMEDKDLTQYFDAPKTRLGVANPTAHADTETDYWGNSYYLIPQGTLMRATHPYADAHSVAAPAHGHHAQPARPNPNALTFAALPGTESSPAKLWVQMRFEKGDKWTTVWNAGTGVRISTEDKGTKEADFEYSLYNRASKLYPTCPSAGYELLRFGRILGPDRFAATAPATTQDNWQPVEFATGQSGYVNLSAASVIKLSDSDFPAASGWQKVTEGATDPARNDGICDIAALQKLIKDADSNHDGITTPEELAAWVQKDEVRNKLRRMICQAPTEWDKSINEARFAPLRKAGAKVEQPAQDNAYGKFKSFVEKFQFWDQTGGLSNTIWHFHPLEFVGHFRKCGWLSKDELERIYPDHLFNRGFAPVPSEVREKYRVHFNKVTRKYCFNDSARLPHFLGQGAIESNRFCQMVEGTHTPTAINAKLPDMVSEDLLGHWYGQIQPQEQNNYYKEPRGGKRSYSWFNGNCGDVDAQKFRGRGFKQITGRALYANYWVYRGWPVLPFDENWWNDPQWIAQNAAGMRKRPAVIDDPQKISIDAYSAIDCGAVYLVSERAKTKSKMDSDRGIATTLAEKKTEKEIIETVTKAINGGSSALELRVDATRLAKEILL
ncbi:hypothetical protein [Silvimonas amylolytica]|uniref:Membrane protein n=1 Tax=Silvimonas amylolytica TaxID=449663 RepID=A0ABQ2PMB5_9NEIS|nr:hypothetical protein [Silvimonas amylolytica]GGP26361.1 membrane protein [Silvimonas amylolytica]